MRESRSYGSVRGALSNERPYRDRRKGSPRKRFALVAGNDDVEVLVICPTG
jgi:hypothetical protein